MLCVQNFVAGSIKTFKLSFISNRFLLAVRRNFGYWPLDIVMTVTFREKNSRVISVENNSRPMVNDEQVLLSGNQNLGIERLVVQTDD